MSDPIPRELVAAKIRGIAKLTGSFTLRSGQVSDTYFDKYLFESDPQLLKAICQHMQALVPGDTQVLCGLELGGIPVVTVLSQLTGLPAAFARKEAKTYGTCKFAEGASLVGRRVLLVEDVVSSGGAIIDTAKMLRAEGVDVDKVVCVIDRRPTGATALQEAGLELNAVFTMAEIESA